MYLRAELIVASLMFSFPLREVSHFPSPLPIISPLRTSMCAFIVVPPLGRIAKIPQLSFVVSLSLQKLLILWPHPSKN